FLGIGLLKGYRLAFNKRGGDGTGKANIQVSEETASVQGCLYEISPEDFKDFRRREKGYFEKEIKVKMASGATRLARTFVAQSARVFRGETSPGYLATIIAG